MARPLGGGRAVRRPRRRPAPEALHPDDVPVPVGRPAHRPLVRGDRAGHRRAHAPHARLQRDVPDGLRQLRAAGRERGDRPRRRSRRVDDREHRAHADPVPNDGRDVRLVARAGDQRPVLLPLDAVDLPPVLRGRAGVPGHGRGRLVPEGPGRAGARAGAGHGAALLALQHAGRQARPRAVVVPDHELLRRAARLRRHRLPRADPPGADELDRPIGGRRDRLRRRGRRRRADPGLHHPPGHRVRRDLHGPGARAPARRGPDDGRPHGPTSRRTSPARGARPRSSA